MAGCNSCGKGSTILNSNSTPTNTLNAIPEEYRVEVTYLGGNYSHRIISPNGALYKYGISNYGTGQYGKKLIIHRDDLVPNNGIKLFEEVVKPIIAQVSEEVTEEPVMEQALVVEEPVITSKKRTSTAKKSLFGELK